MFSNCGTQNCQCLEGTLLVVRPVCMPGLGLPAPHYTIHEHNFQLHVPSFQALLSCSAHTFVLFGPKMYITYSVGSARESIDHCGASLSGMLLGFMIYHDSQTIKHAALALGFVNLGSCQPWFHTELNLYSMCMSIVLAWPFTWNLAIDHALQTYNWDWNKWWRIFNFSKTLHAAMEPYFIISCSLQDGWAALLCASQNGHSNIVMKLLAAGAHPDHQQNVRNLY